MGWKQQMLGVAAIASLAMTGGTAQAQSSTPAPGGQHGQTAAGGHGQDAQGHESRAANTGADKFYKKAAMGNMAEVQLAKLGAQKAQNPQVKQFAQQMADAHQRALDELKQVAAGNVDWPSTVDEKHRKAHDKLSGLSGEEFDREFMSAMVNAHEDMEDLLENYVGENRMGSADQRPGASGTSGMGGTATGTTTGQTAGSTSGSGTGSTSTGAGQSAAGTSGSADSTRLSGAAHDWASKSLREVRSHLEQAKELKDQIGK